MKRIVAALSLALVMSSMLAGCSGGGIEEGTSTEGATASGQPAGFEDMMKKNADNMKLKGQRPKPVPSPAPE